MKITQKRLKRFATLREVSAFHPEIMWKPGNKVFYGQEPPSGESTTT